MSQPTSPSSVSTELQLPEIHAQDLPEWRAAQPGQLLELADGQQAVVTAAGPESLTLLRVAWPRGGALPLGEVFTAGAAELAPPLRLLGAWYPPKSTPPPERILLEAIRRGFITSHSCGVPWPLGGTMQLSEEAADRIERYLFEVARSTGCAFPFHDIAEAMRSMHLCPRPDNPALCDILSAEELKGRAKPSDEDLLAFWAREVRRRIHTSDWLAPPL